ncbi:alpha/beta hydrolase [bacterium 336/3]|nr:alpha/beta hydrolase [bacterium 336/3]
MEIREHQHNETKIAEIVSESMIIATTEDGLDVLASLYFQGFDKIIIHQNNITPDFFDLKTGIAGEILQKFSNYRVQLAIIGDFSQYISKSLKDFIFESNKQGHIIFVESLDDVMRNFKK